MTDGYFRLKIMKPRPPEYTAVTKTRSKAKLLWTDPELARLIMDVEESHVRKAAAQPVMM